MRRPLLLLMVTVLSMSVQSTSGRAQSSWTVMSPPSILNGVCFTGKQTGFAVGGAFQGASRGMAGGVSGTICRTTDGGFTWTRQEILVPQILHAVSFSDSSNGIAVGGDNDTTVVLRTKDGGMSWACEVIRSLGLIKAVWAMDAENFVVVGSSMDGRRPVIQRTTNGGTSWKPASWPASGCLLNDVWFTDANKGFAVGSTPDPPHAVILHTTDGGVGWTADAIGARPPLRCVTFVDSMTGFAVGGGYDNTGRGRMIPLCLRTTDGGKSWTDQEVAHEGTLSGVSFGDAYHGVLVGESWDASGSSVGALILRTTDGGRTWNDESTAELCPLAGVWVTDSGDCAVVGDRTVSSTTDAGASWHQWGSAGDLFAVAFLDADEASAVGDCGTVLHTHDGGTCWDRQRSGVVCRLTDISFDRTRCGIAVGDSGTILRTTDGGRTWERQLSGTGANLSAIHRMNAESATVVGTIEPRGAQLPSAVVLHATDGGSTWIPTDTLPGLLLRDVCFSDPDTGIAVGSRFDITEDHTERACILRTTDGGKTWTKQVIPVNNFGWLSSVSFADARVGSAVGNSWTSNGADSATVYWTTDGGATWIDKSFLSEEGCYLNRVVMTDSRTAIAVGHTPLVHGDGIPRVLRTTDGGTTWSNEGLPTVSGWLQGVGFNAAGAGIAVGSGGLTIRSTAEGGTWVADPLAAGTGVPERPWLCQNYPNPFNPSTTIAYELPKSSMVRLVVYDMLGREVAVLVDGRMEAGVREVKFEASDLSSGVYFYRLQVRPLDSATGRDARSGGGDFTQTRRLMLLK